MTMQEQDYTRVSSSIRSSLDATLRDLSKDDSPAVAETVIASYRRLVAEIARSFHSADPRFRVSQFMTDALGASEGKVALTLYDAAYGRRG